jgi:hypothetical protein
MVVVSSSLDDGMPEHPPVLGEDPTGTLLPADPRKPPSRTPSAATRRTHKIARWLHVYASMLALLIVLFFGITGLTLNHPDWAFGGSTTAETVHGTFPFPATSDGSVAWLPIAEYARTTYDVKGTVANFEASGDQGSIAFTNPGYAATLLFDTTTGDYELTVEQQGFIAVMNDLHKGRDAAPAWKWTIDVAAIFLVAVSLTGLLMQLVLRKRRRSALVTASVGVALCVLLMVVTLR